MAATQAARSLAMVVAASACALAIGRPTAPDRAAASAARADASAGMLAARPSLTAAAPRSPVAPSPTPSPAPSAIPSAPASPAPSAIPSSPASPTPSAIPSAPASPAPIRGSPDPGLVLHVPVLMYHLVATPGEAQGAASDLVVPPATFDQQLRALHAAGWRTITMARLADLVAQGRRPPPQTFVITIDDGYVNAYTRALPILQTYDFVATFYVVAGRVGHGARELTWPQVRALVADGMDIGNHTVSHPDLTRSSDWDLGWQIRHAQELVLAQTGYRMTTVAYPAGRWDGRVAGAVEKEGLLMGVTTRQGARESWGDRYACSRVRVSPGTGGSWLVITVSHLAGG